MVLMLLRIELKETSGKVVRKGRKAKKRNIVPFFCCLKLSIPTEKYHIGSIKYKKWRCPHGKKRPGTGRTAPGDMGDSR